MDTDSGTIPQGCGLRTPGRKQNEMTVQGVEPKREQYVSNYKREIPQMSDE